MNWKEKIDVFKYCGETVNRKKLISMTPIGLFEVSETVSGKVFVRHPLINSVYINNGYNNGLEEWFGSTKRFVSTIEEGIKLCEKNWIEFKNLVNAI